MNCMRIFSIPVFSLALVAAVGCSGAATDDSTTADTDEALLGGTATFDVPAVGELVTHCNPKTNICELCTASMVAPRVLVTAAHCLNYETKNGAGNYGWFTVQRSASQSYSYTVSRYRSFASSGPGSNDLAIVQLDTNVPDSIARPLSLATSMPPRGTQVTDFGYGCTNRGNGQPGVGTKRKRTHAQGSDINELCPGDSGGPMIWGTSVFAINSGYSPGFLWFSPYDIYAIVPDHHGDLQAQVNAWK
jgi:secreted trypsin-like serine protease